MPNAASGCLLRQPGVVGDRLAGVPLRLEQDHEAEGAEVHEGVDQHVEQHRLDAASAPAATRPSSA